MSTRALIVDPAHCYRIKTRWLPDNRAPSLSAILSLCYSQTLGNGTLYFPPFRAEDYRKDLHSTVYRCRASNLAGTILSRDVNVRAGQDFVCLHVIYTYLGIYTATGFLATPLCLPWILIHSPLIAKKAKSYRNIPIQAALKCSLNGRLTCNRLARNELYGCGISGFDLHRIQTAHISGNKQSIRTVGETFFPTKPF